MSASIGLQRAVLVTGASTGIGEQTALRLAARGFRVYAGVRKAEDEARLLAQAKGDLRCVRLDVTSADEIQKICELLNREESGHGLFGLVNNAGTTLLGPFEALDINELRRLFEVNLVGPAALMQGLIPLLRKARGRIVNISSTSGLVAWPFSSAYVASKYALEGLTDVLRLELQEFGVTLSLVEPGAVKTPLWNKIFEDFDRRLEKYDPEVRARYESKLRGARAMVQNTVEKFAMPPAVVVDAIEDALVSVRPRIRYVLGPSAKAQVALKGLLSARAFDALKMRLARPKEGRA